MTQLERLAKHGILAFDLDFLRAMGFEIGSDWDGELLLSPPETINVAKLTTLILTFRQGLEQRLRFELHKRLNICVGGPKNGAPAGLANPVYFHVARGQWLVYAHRDDPDDPRRRYFGTATSKKKARQLWLGSTKKSG